MLRVWHCVRDRCNGNVRCINRPFAEGCGDSNGTPLADANGGKTRYHSRKGMRTLLARIRSLTGGNDGRTQSISGSQYFGGVNGGEKVGVDAGSGKKATGNDVGARGGEHVLRRAMHNFLAQAPRLRAVPATTRWRKLKLAIERTGRHSLLAAFTSVPR